MKRINPYPPFFLLTCQMAIIVKGGRGDFEIKGFHSKIILLKLNLTLSWER